MMINNNVINMGVSAMQYISKVLHGMVHMLLLHKQGSAAPLIYANHSI